MERRGSNTGSAPASNAEGAWYRSIVSATRALGAAAIALIVAASPAVAQSGTSGRESEPKNAGPVAEQLFRNFQQMSAEDQESLAKFAKLLAEKNRERRGEA